MSGNRTKRLRALKAAAQQDRCYYCLFPMWSDSAEAFAKAHRISAAEAERFRCTAEHLKAQSEGGPTAASNIVAACRFCNQHRQRRSKNVAPDLYKSLVQRRVARSSWHPPWLHKLRIAAS